jgi:hypothetical protein
VTVQAAGSRAEKQQPHSGSSGVFSGSERASATDAEGHEPGTPEVERRCAAHRGTG